MPITIDVIDPQGNFDEVSYDNARMTFKDIVEKNIINERSEYEDFVNTYNRIQKQKEFEDTINVMP